MSSEGFVRARRPEQKQQRRETILAAAGELALEHGVRGVTLGSVAEVVGLAKSNVIRYYGTREEIFLVLTAEGWREWREAVSARLGAGDDAVTVLAGTLAERPLFCDLLSHTATTLEHNISLDAARIFKHAVLATVRALGADVSRALPGLTGERQPTSSRRPPPSRARSTRWRRRRRCWPSCTPWSPNSPRPARRCFRHSTERCPRSPRACPLCADGRTP